MMYEGSCLCGSIKYKIEGDIKAVTNCHCTMCQKQHGAAFATYGSTLKDDIQLCGIEILSTYKSSEGVSRKFCTHCGSSLFWEGSKYPEWTISIALGTLNTEFKAIKVNDIYTKTKVCWLSPNEEAASDYSGEDN